MQPMSLMFKVAGADTDRAVFPGGFEDNIEIPKGAIQDLGKEHLPASTGHVLLYRSTLPGIVTCNMTNVNGVDGTDVRDLTKAHVTARRQIEPIVQFLREFIPGYEKCYVIMAASYIGIRETRHLDGTDYFGAGICPDGWDPRYWYDGRNYLEDLPEQERSLWRSGLGTAAAIHERGITREWTWAGRITEKARSFITNRGINSPDEPWLLVVSYDEPHGPSVCPPPFCDMYDDFAYPLPTNAHDGMDKKPSHHRAWQHAFSIPEDGLRQPLYFGAGAFVDDEIGRLVDAARESAADDTIIIYTTDHGHYLEAHGLDGKGPALYEEVVRVPILMSGGGVPEGATSDPLVSHVDILPTLLDIAGAEIPRMLESVSQTPVLRDPAARVRTEALSEFHRSSVTHDSWFGFIPIRSLISARYKLTVNLDQSDELYDLESGPGEMHNLIGCPEHAEAQSELHRKLLDLMDSSRDPFRSPRWADRGWSSVEAPPGIGGKRRPRHRDGFLPPPFNYDTGMPADWGGH